MQLVARLPAMEAGLLDWVVQLMADVAQRESINKMGSRNVAIVFAPNMTQVSWQDWWRRTCLASH